jgi:peptidoglycan glycosyltransferase
VSLGTTRSVLAGDGLAVRPADPGRLLVYLIALFGAHLAQVLAGRRTDQVLLPAVGLLGGLGLLLMERLPQDLAGSAFGNALGLASVQLVWLLIAVTVITVLAIVVRSDTWLRRYKYTWAAVGIGLLLLTFVFGKEANGALLTIQIDNSAASRRSCSRSSSMFLAATSRSSAAARRGERSSVPPAAAAAVSAADDRDVGVAFGIVVIQRDLGAALLFFTASSSCTSRPPG